MSRDKTSQTPGRIVWPKFPRRKREYGHPPKGPVQMKSVITSFGIEGIDRKLQEYKIKKCWTEAVGPKIAQKTEPLMLIDSTLHCAVSSSPWITELNYQKQAIIEKINAAVGETVVSEIIFKPGTVKDIDHEPRQEREPVEKIPTKVSAEQRAFINSTVESIKDPEIKEAVRKAMEKATRPEAKQKP